MKDPRNDDTLLALFEDGERAAAAAERLRVTGVPDEVVVERAGAGRSAVTENPSPLTQRLPVGLLLGAVGGLTLEATMLPIPGAGPLLTGGVATAALVGGSAGAAATALWDGMRTRTEGTPGRRAVVRATVHDPLQRDEARRLLRVAGALETTGTDEDERTHFIRGFSEFSAPLRSHFEATYAVRGEHWAVWELCYRFGWQLANRPDMSSRQWDDAEPDVRREWEVRHPDRPWSAVAPAVERGFRIMRQRRS